MFSRLLLCLALGWPMATVAQSAVGSDPADARAAVPSLRYQSAFAAYRRYEEPKLASRREPNAEMQKAVEEATISSAAGTTSPTSESPAGVIVRKPGAHQHQH